MTVVESEGKEKQPVCEAREAEDEEGLQIETKVRNLAAGQDAELPQSGNPGPQQKRNRGRSPGMT